MHGVIQHLIEHIGVRGPGSSLELRRIPQTAMAASVALLRGAPGGAQLPAVATLIGRAPPLRDSLQRDIGAVLMRRGDTRSLSLLLKLSDRYWPKERSSRGRDRTDPWLSFLIRPEAIDAPAPDRASLRDLLPEHPQLTFWFAEHALEEDRAVLYAEVKRRTGTGDLDALARALVRLGKPEDLEVVADLLLHGDSLEAGVLLVRQQAAGRTALLSALDRSASVEVPYPAARDQTLAAALVMLASSEHVVPALLRALRQRRELGLPGEGLLPALWSHAENPLVGPERLSVEAWLRWGEGR